MPRAAATGTAGSPPQARPATRPAPAVHPAVAPPAMADEERPNRAVVGRSIAIKGDLSGAEDLFVEGEVEGRIDLPDHHLIVGPAGRVVGEVTAREVTVVGAVDGNIRALERLDVSRTGEVNGDIVAGALLIAEGAQVNGTISMAAPKPPATEEASLRAASGSASATRAGGPSPAEESTRARENGDAPEMSESVDDEPLTSGKPPKKK